MIKTKTIIDIYSDGSGNSINSDGGWGYVIIIDGVKFKEKGGFLLNATNNVAELQAAIMGLRCIAKTLNLINISIDDCIITLISDSQLVLNYAKNTWKCKKEHLRSLNLELQYLHNSLNIQTKWVKGHSGNEHNETCDMLAGMNRKQGRKKIYTQSFIKTLIRLKLIKNSKTLEQVWLGIGHRY